MDGKSEKARSRGKRKVTLKRCLSNEIGPSISSSRPNKLKFDIYV